MVGIMVVPLGVTSWEIAMAGRHLTVNVKRRMNSEHRKRRRFGIVLLVVLKQERKIFYLDSASSNTGMKTKAMMSDSSNHHASSHAVSLLQFGEMQPAIHSTSADCVSPVV